MKNQNIFSILIRRTVGMSWRAYSICVLFFSLLTTDALSRDWQVWVFIGQSLMGGPVGEVAVLTDDSHDGEILEYTRGRGLDSNKIRSIEDVHLSKGQVGPPEIFARRLWEYGERDIAIIKIAPGGYSITAFLSEDRRLTPKKTNNVDLWPYWVDVVQGKLDWLVSQGDSATLRGIVMFQGSSDRTSTFISVYEEHLRRLIVDTRSYLNLPLLPWLQIVSPTWSPGNITNSQLQSIQRSVVAEFESASFVESDNPMGIPLIFTDGTHPDLASTPPVSA